MIMASDQGATISMDGGKSWSSWYNQPTGQIYHLSTDNRYPYWVYGTQQDSGSVGTLSRGDYGEITFMDWDPVGGYEFGYIVPDPLNNNLVYAGGPSRGVVRIDRTNRQVATVSPSVTRGDTQYRMATNPPLAFSPQDPHILYMGAQFLLETRDGGLHWKRISPDLTKTAETPAPATAPDSSAAAPALPARPRAQEQQETIAPTNRAAINSFTPSPKAAGEIWVGTNNGIVQLTRDSGATWQNVSPPGLAALSQISLIEASHFDAGTAYAAVDRHEENDFHAHFYRTHDFGKTWQETSAGIPDGSFARVVREDPMRKGLLYAGTENAAYVSFDEGDHWSSLQLNMPTTSVRDLVVHGDDLVAATYGRAFWILDDVTPLRQIDRTVSSAPALLFRPEKALRVRLDLNQDTPIPPDMPAGQNPPNGAIVDYWVASEPSQDVRLAIYDSAGQTGARVLNESGGGRKGTAAERAGILGGAPRSAHEKCRHEPLRVGPALCPAAGVAPRVSHFCALSEHAGPAAGRHGDAGQLQGPVDRERAHLRAAPGSGDGSAGGRNRRCPGAATYTLAQDPGVSGRQLRVV